MGLLDALKQYVKDAMPGGLLNSEWTPENVRMAGEAASMIPNPMGDVASGLLALDDARKGDYGSAALNGFGLLPFVPAMGGVIKKAAPRAEAMRIAQQNAAKPVSEGGLGLRPDNTPMERARAMGGVDVFHGQAKTPEKLIYEDGVYLGKQEPNMVPLEQIRANGGNAEGGAFYAINDVELANMYAYPNGKQAGAIYPMVVFPKNMAEAGFTKPMPEGDISQWMREVEAYNRGLDRTKNRYFSSEIRNAKETGKDGVIFRNTEDAPSSFDFGGVPAADVYAVTNPAAIRSRFAAFDPARRHEADLLGQVRPDFLPWLIGAGLLGGYGVKQAQEKDRQ